MRILAIDPATIVSGWAIIEDGIVLDAGLCSCAPANAFEQRLYMIYEYFSELIDVAKPDMVAIETPFHHVNAGVTAKLNMLQGVLRVLACIKELSIIKISPQSAKNAVMRKVNRTTKRHNYTKEEIRDAVNEIYNQEIQDLNISDACAVGFAAFQMFS